MTKVEKYSYARFNSDLYNMKSKVEFSEGKNYNGEKGAGIRGG